MDVTFSVTNAAGVGTSCLNGVGFCLLRQAYGKFGSFWDAYDSKYADKVKIVGVDQI